MNNPNVCIGLGCLLGAALASTVFALGIGADPISWADAHNGLITAASTTVVATFTVVLAWVTRTQARLTREALITTERAFVFLEDFDHRWIFQPGSLSGASGRMITRPPTFTEFIINLRWKNNGTTPTRNMRVIVGWTATFGPLSADFEYKTDRAPRKMFLAPQANEWSDPIVLPPSVATAALNGTTQVYVWGRVDYDDIFE
ncbi:MAG TPA: hypothetical protein VG328_20340, partial [Stellaceae bacterium]|nr:hypothetical protein [Stellaceae bacterium]